VRPSPGAAALQGGQALRSPGVSALSHLAAPGDGRTPAALSGRDSQAVTVIPRRALCALCGKTRLIRIARGLKSGSSLMTANSSFIKARALWWTNAKGARRKAERQGETGNLANLR